jgi:hypothetical protein
VLAGALTLRDVSGPRYLGSTTAAKRKTCTTALRSRSRHAKDLLSPSVVSRPLTGNPPTIDVFVGYNRSNTSPILKLFLSRLDELKDPSQTD